MNNKLQLISKITRLTCTWVQTCDKNRPLACVWMNAKTPQAASVASATDESGRMHLCA